MKRLVSRTSIVKPESEGMTMRSSWLIFLFCILSSGAARAEAPKNELAYTWKNGELFRFDYLKTITVKQPNEEGQIEERQTEMAAVLILEIKSVTAAGAAATLRFDSPRVTLPTIRFFSAQNDNVESQVDKTRSLARAIEGAIKTARWTVLLQHDGSIKIETRTPANLNEWLKESGNTAGWRKKTQEAMLKLLDQDLGLKVQTMDRETLACLGNVSKEGETAKGEALHPLRSALVVASRKDDKALLTFKRVFEKKQAEPYAVPQLTSSANINIKVSVDGLTTADGSAVFDTKIGCVDTINEDYTAKVNYVSGKDNLLQEVRVQYKLKRLAPAIVKAE